MTHSGSHNFLLEKLGANSPCLPFSFNHQIILPALESTCLKGCWSLAAVFEQSGGLLCHENLEKQ